MRLSQRAVSALEVGQWCSESLGYGMGSMQVRATPSGIRFYYRTGGERHRIPLGAATGKHSITLDQAREQCLALAADTASARPVDTSLGAMLVCYAQRLEARGATTAPEVLAMFQRHIQKPSPRLWLRAARTIDARDLLGVIEPLVGQGKLPTARKLRATLNSAFQVALQADYCAQSVEFRRFRVTENPVRKIRSVEGGQTLPDRVLSVAELQALWAHLNQMTSPQGSVLRFYLLTGAQRLEQLLRATRDDLTEEGLILWDGKGRRQDHRLHLVPLIPPARLALTAMTRRGPHVVSIDGGRSSLHPSTIWRYVTGVADDLLSHGRVRSHFSPADLRRTVETRLAALKVPPEVRAHLQSHGLEGIQARHYDRHTYLDEKYEALRRLLQLMRPKAQVRTEKSRRQANA